MDDDPTPATWPVHAWQVGREVGREWRDDRVTGLAAEVAFFAVLSLFPALLAVTAMLGFLETVAGREVAARAEDAVVSAFEDVLSDDASGTVDAVAALFAESNPGLLTVSLLGALLAASRGFTALIRALDEVYDLEERRGYGRLRAMALGLAVGTVVIGALLLAMVVVGPLLGSGQDVADELGAGGAFATAWDWARWPAVGLALVAWAATIFHLAPNHRTPWRWDVPGAVLSAVLWVALSIGLRLYLAVAPEANQVFGTLGGALIVLLWLYLLALGLLVGGELNAVLARRHGVAQVPRRSIAPPRWWDRIQAWARQRTAYGRRL